MPKLPRNPRTWCRPEKAQGVGNTDKLLLLFAFDVKGSAAARSFPPRAQSGWLRQLAVEQTLTTRARYRTCNDLTAHGSIALNSGPRHVPPERKTLLLLAVLHGHLQRGWY
ncbi:unnamed protein product [Rangifer tarandus platyrhynchus]|uniref:Uncharacterized protein n=1 Tax=Rangifer tarandus platyrhynchus TaxID=3082113 RepID=A0ACB1KH77_RANTA